MSEAFDTPAGRTYSGPVTAPETAPGDGPRRITSEEAAARGDWVQLERKAAPETTPGRAAYEALHHSIARRQPAHLWVTWESVDEINDGIPGEPLREDMEAAVTAAQQPLRDGITELLAGITASADATRPSKKTALEDEFAIALRKLLETP